MTDQLETSQMLKIALTLMEGLDCPRSLTVAILIRNGEWDQLTSLEASSLHYLTHEEYLRAVGATDLLRKYPGFTIPGLDLSASTLEKWWWAERECFKTNRRLFNLEVDCSSHGEALREFFSRVRKNCEAILGFSPPTTWEGRFGPGATVSDTSRLSTVPDKMSSVPSITPSAKFYRIPWSGTKWASASAALGRETSYVKGNEYFTVPKTARTLRSCAKEPSINGFFQLGLGRVMKDRLRRAGLDLQAGKPIHMRLAQQASLDGKRATIDLTSASDCVSTGLVSLCLPPRWAEALNDLRSPMTKVGGKWVRLEKFSSMGNGFTFELETVIFAAIALSVIPGSRLGVDVHVYGDDIIVPTSSYDDVAWALKYCGFTLNPRKSFRDGCFRESCGGDYFLGRSARAHYIEDSPEEPQDWIVLANGLRRLIMQFDEQARKPLLRSWFLCLDQIPSRVRSCRGPEALGDIVIHDAEDRWTIRWRSSGIRYVQVYRPLPGRGATFGRFNVDVQFAAALYGVAPRSTGARPPHYDPVMDMREVLGRDAVGGHKVGWVPFS